MIVKVRSIGSDDWRVWRSLRLAALTQAPDAYSTKLADWQGAGDDEQRWRSRLASVAANYVAFADERFAGIVSGIGPDLEGTAELVSLWVEPFARGHRIGDALVIAVVAWAREVGANRIVLDTAPENGRARSLYRRNGFVDLTPVVAPAEHPMVLNIRHSHPLVIEVFDLARMND